MKIFYFFLFFPFLLSAQSEFFKDSDLGVKADFAFSHNKDLSGMGVGFGISLLNVVDIGFEYFKSSNKPKYDIEAYSRILYAAYNFRSNDNNLKVLGGYSHNSYNIKELSFLLNEFTGPILGVVISPEIYKNNILRLIPSLSFSMIFLSPVSRKDDGRNHNINVDLEFNVISKINNKLNYVISPTILKSLSHWEAPLIYGLNFGLLFNAQKR